MIRDDLIQLMAKAHLSYGRHPAMRSPVPMQGDIDAMSDALSALEAAGVRLVPVNLPPRLQYVGAAYLAREGATGVTPEAFAGAFEEVLLDLAASPYAPEQKETPE